MTDNPYWRPPKLKPAYGNGTDCYVQPLSREPIQHALLEGTPCDVNLALDVYFRARLQGMEVNIEWPKGELPRD
jgi:hypothetical protein